MQDMEDEEEQEFPVQLWRFVLDKRKGNQSKAEPETHVFLSLWIGEKNVVCTAKATVRPKEKRISREDHFQFQGGGFCSVEKLKTREVFLLL